MSLTRGSFGAGATVADRVAAQLENIATVAAAFDRLIQELKTRGQLPTGTVNRREAGGQQGMSLDYQRAAALERGKQALTDAQRKLAKLGNTDMPRAQQADRRAFEQQMQREKASVKAKMEALADDLASAIEATDDITNEVRREQHKRPQAIPTPRGIPGAPSLPPRIGQGSGPGHPGGPGPGFPGRGGIDTGMAGGGSGPGGGGSTDPMTAATELQQVKVKLTEAKRAVESARN